MSDNLRIEIVCHGKRVPRQVWLRNTIRRLSWPNPASRRITQKIARSMFEAECNIHHMKTSAGALQDYIDFNVIDQKRLYGMLTSQEQSQADPAKVADMNADYARISPRFVRNRKGDIRDNWCAISLHKRAQAAGLEDLYQTFYGWTSSMHHGDLGAIVSSFNQETNDIETAPSFQWLEQALVEAHGALVRSLGYYLEIANIGFDEEIEALRKECVELFRQAAGH
jgi:hypothetical protein